MATVADLVAAVDAFMAASKRIVGYEVAPTWGPGRSPLEREMKYPIEVEGEQRAQLMIVAFPREPELKFRLGILLPAMICRIDHTDESHNNTLTGFVTGAVPLVVRGPHYHSWPLNRRFFRGATVSPELHDAAPLNNSGRSFDAVLRWFCTDTNIDPLPPDHRIVLPRRDQLL